jgi:hypothetical protein
MQLAIANGLRQCLQQGLGGKRSILDHVPPMRLLIRCGLVELCLVWPRMRQVRFLSEYRFGERLQDVSRAVGHERAIRKFEHQSSEVVTVEFFFVR